MPGTRNSGLLALGGIALAALLAVIGHLEVNEDLDPWSLTVSDYAVSDRGGVIDVAMVVLAAATAALLPALRRAVTPADNRRPRPGRIAGGRLGEILLAAWVGGLLLAAIVPTNEPGLPMDTAAYVHRYASVVAFLALPVGGWLLARRLPAATGRWVRGFALASLALAAVMVWSAYPGDRVLLGLIERLLILAEVALLATVALWFGTRRQRPARPERLPLRPASHDRGLVGLECRD
ncbi:DUF998 domain-containing protein [Micromonospora sp. C28SCA-DRY-2]|uniref:DUF998 domain-containing protein n=1 Tax=Micromonospora sp. C28SCA-DRY-2 TaxID=3059522 RepID=UPI002675AFB4|nr:DUF998 domain-containing protein [Micromonospora sp. C28SCA-DRY-2]MDO3701241.1 DUF998 domain-containing protein [Micromonospora sp. C28SCA-DRY-2]